MPNSNLPVAACAALALLSIAACAGSAPPPACKAITFDGTPYSVCSFDPAVTDLRLAHTAPDGLIYGQFDRLAAAYEANGNTLTFAMNAGMYHQDRSPVGLYIQDTVETAPLQVGASPGNFGMVPNGVLLLGPEWAAVSETSVYQLAKWPGNITYATQSGPMLVIDGQLHPKFNANGPSKKRRNGVGVSADGHIHFAISEVPVNFHSFARLFRDELNTPNALFLDGQVSKLYSTDLKRNDQGLDMGPIVAVVE